MATKKIAKKVVKVEAPIQALWADQDFRAKMVTQGRKTMSTLWAKRGFRKTVKEGMKAKWADPAFRAMMQRRMHEARAAKQA
jgi:hypothetical protein